MSKTFLFCLACSGVYIWKLFLLFLFRGFIQINHIFEILLRATSVLGVSKETDLNFELILCIDITKMFRNFSFENLLFRFDQLGLKKQNISKIDIFPVTSTRCIRFLVFMFFIQIPSSQQVRKKTKVKFNL